MSYICTFNNYDLLGYFDVSYEIDRVLPEWEPTIIEVPASNVAIFGGTRAKPMKVGMTLITKDGFNRDTRQLIIRELARILAVDYPRQLVLGDEHGLYRLAMPNGEMEITPHLNADTIHVEFICPDPRLYGDTETRTVSTSATTVNVGGTANTEPTVTVTATPNSSGVWRIEDSTSGQLMQVSGLSTGSSHSLVFDCNSRQLSVDGTVAMLDTNSDWFSLKPGNHSMRVTAGSGSATLQFIEKWW